ncbi:hypothetical protein IIA15_07025 [candidate division TA06 bacterium]|nr:hypothetical protein [candidate division TA06 bacterium]
MSRVQKNSSSGHSTKLPATSSGQAWQAVAMRSALRVRASLREPEGSSEPRTAESRTWQAGLKKSFQIAKLAIQN